MINLQQAMRFAIYLALFSGFLALASVRLYGLPVMFVPLALMALNIMAERWEENRAFRFFKSAISVLYAIFILISIFIMGLLQAVLSLVVFIICYLMLGRLTIKSAYELLLMAFFLVLGAVVQSPEPLIAVALAGLLLSTVWSFSLLTVHADRISAAAARPATVVNAQERVITDTWQVWHVLGTLSVVSAIALVLGGLLFLLTPRVEAGIFGRADYQRAVTGLTDRVRLDGGMSIYQDTSAVMHVEFPEEPEGVLIPADALYWRVTTLSRFDGAEWSRYQLPAQNREVPLIWPFVSGGGLIQIGKAVQRDTRPGRRLVKQEIFVDDVPTGALPILDLVQYVALEGDERNPMTVQWDPGGDYTVILNTSRGPRRLTYQATSELFQPSPEMLQSAPWTVTDLPAPYLQILLYHDLLEGTRALIDEVTRGAASPYAAMQALVDWLSGPDFTYTLDLPPLPPTHPIDAFLTQTRRGHCELFASALALAARYKGIPTRVVSGYRGGDYNPSERAYIVRANMSHLWVEAYFQGIGWVRFDPSPRSDYIPTGLAYIRQRWSQQLLLAKMFWYRSVMGFEGGWRLDNLVARISSRDHGGVPGSGMIESFLEFTSPDSRGRVLLPVFMVGLLLLAAAGAAWRILWKGPSPYKRILLTAHQRNAQRLLRSLRRQLAKAGVDTRGLTAEELIRSAAKSPLVDDLKLEPLLVYYEQVRFGGGSMTFSDLWRLRKVSVLRAQKGRN